MSECTITGKAWEPNSRYTQSGICVSEINVSVYDGKDQEGKSKYYPITVKAFKELAEAVGNGIQQGDNIIATGRLTVEQWEKDGVKQRKAVLLANDIGKSLRQFAAKPKAEIDQPFGGQEVIEEVIPF